MGWVAVPRRSNAGNITGYRVVNSVTRRQINGRTAANLHSKTAALAMIAAINAGYKQQSEAKRRRLEAATAAAATRRRNRNRGRRR